MDTVPRPNLSAESAAAEPPPPLPSERGRLREFLAAQERRFTRVEALLREEVERLDRQLRVSDEAIAELRQQREELAQRERAISQRQGELGAAESRLQQQFVAARASAAMSTGGAPLGRSSWEVEKGRILAALESETDSEDAVEVGARLQLEEIIATTDRLVADKDREVAELQSLLASQSGNFGDVAVGAAAVGQLLDQDTVVQQQRETLQRLQEQWMEKLRQAEIDISRERAQLRGKGSNSTKKFVSWSRISPRRKAKRPAARPRARRVAAAGWRGLG